MSVLPVTQTACTMMYNFAFYSKLRHDNVLSLLGVSLDSNPLMIVLEYCGNGNLKSYLLKRRSQAQEMMVDGTVMGIICDMAAGLNYLNSLEVAHKLDQHEFINSVVY